LVCVLAHPVCGHCVCDGCSMCGQRVHGARQSVSHHLCCVRTPISRCIVSARKSVCSGSMCMAGWQTRPLACLQADCGVRVAQAHSGCLYSSSSSSSSLPPTNLYASMGVRCQECPTASQEPTRVHELAGRGVGVSVAGSSQGSRGERGWGLQLCTVCGAGGA
jgi:hypothetical protein